MPYAASLATQLAQQCLGLVLLRELAIDQLLQRIDGVFRIAQSRGDHRIVIAHCRVGGPGNLTALNNLAWNLRRENPAEALKYIRRAWELAPNLPELLDTLAVIEFYNGQHVSAQRNIRLALEARPNNPTMRYHDAMIAVALGVRCLAQCDRVRREDAQGTGQQRFPGKRRSTSPVK